MPRVIYSSPSGLHWTRLKLGRSDDIMMVWVIDLEIWNEDMCQLGCKSEIDSKWKSFLKQLSFFPSIKYNLIFCYVPQIFTLNKQQIPYLTKSLRKLNVLHICVWVLHIFRDLAAGEASPAEFLWSHVTLLCLNKLHSCFTGLRGSEVKCCCSFRAASDRRHQSPWQRSGCVGSAADQSASSSRQKGRGRAWLHPHWHQTGEKQYCAAGTYWIRSVQVFHITHSTSCTVDIPEERGSAIYSLH